MVKCECGWNSDKDPAFVNYHRSLKYYFPDDPKEIAIYCAKCRRTLYFHIQDQIEE